MRVSQPVTHMYRVVKLQNHTLFGRIDTLSDTNSDCDSLLTKHSHRNAET